MEAWSLNHWTTREFPSCFSNTVNRRLFFPHLCSLHSCRRLIDCICMGLFLGFLFHSTDQCVCFFIPVVVIVYLLRNGARWLNHGLRMRGNSIAEAMKQEWNTDRSEVDPGPWRTAEFSSFHGQGSEHLLVGFINQSGQIAHLRLTWDSVVPRT